MRVRIPFGIASTGVCFRNEITLGQGVFRTLQFDLMEFEYFIKSGDWEKTFEMFKDEMWAWALELGLEKENSVGGNMKILRGRTTPKKPWTLNTISLLAGKKCGDWLIGLITI